MPNHKHGSGDDEIIIVDLDPIEQNRESNHKSFLDEQRLVFWMRLGLVLLVLVGSFALFYFFWPNASFILKKIRSQPAQSGTTTSSITQDISFDLLPTHNVTYISSFNTSYTNTHGTLDAIRVQDGTLLWHYSGGLTSSPLLINGVLYISSTTGIDALRANDHSLLWHNPESVQSWQISNGVLYAISSRAGLLAIRVRDGKTLWLYKGIVAETPIIVNNTIYLHFKSDFSYVYALHVSDGTTLWRYKLPDKFNNGVTIQKANGVICVTSQSNYGGLAVLSSSTGVLLWEADNVRLNLPQEYNPGNILYITSSMDGSIDGRRLSDGSVLWHYPLSASSPLQIQDNSIYFIASDGMLHALRGSDGTALWQHQIVAANFGGPQINTIQNSVLCMHIPNYDGDTIFGLRISDGSQLWQFHISSTMGGLLPPASMPDGNIYTSTAYNDVHGFIQALRVRDGSIRWHFNADGYPNAFESLTKDNITYIISSTRGVVIALRADNGSVLWHYQGNIPITS